MTARSADQLARRYVAWLTRRTWPILIVHALLVAASAYLIAFHLPLRADFSYLLPQDAPAVRDLRKLEARIRGGDTMLVLIQAPDAATREAATREFVAGAQKLPGDLIEAIDWDDSGVRAFLKAHRHLFVPLADLEAGYQALVETIEQKKLEANPLFIDLDDEKDPAEARAAEQKMADLQKARRDADARLEQPTNISKDGRLIQIQIRTRFRGTDAANGRRLLEGFGAIRSQIEAKYRGVEIGFAGGVVAAVFENDAIIKGMVLSTAITMGLVGLFLALYFRSATLLVMLLATLAMASTIAFGFAAITVGHLNAATAFLGAIIAGNGINYGILLIARYLEERRQHEPGEAMAVAIAGTLRPTAIASLGASIAYGSLAATSFRGFADFAIIGAVGMLVFWMISYILLPALVLRWGRTTRIHTGDPVVGSALVKLFGFRRSGVVCVVALVVSIASSVIVYRYIAADPFEYDIKQLRSEGEDAIVARGWMELSDKHFGRGITARTYIAADREDQVPLIVEALRQRDANLPKDQQAIGSVLSVLDVVPDEQSKKLEVLAKIREVLDGKDVQQLPEEDQRELRALRPPDDLRPITVDRLPEMLAARLEEKDGRRGLLISIRPADHLDEWDGRALIRFARAVRKVELADQSTITTSGSSVIFADIVESIERDGPIVTGVAILGITVMCLLLVGRNRRSLAVLLGTGSGTLLMVAICALLGIKVNFLDFIALPITIGLGVDYAINMAHRFDSDQLHDPIVTLRTSGSAVFMCSLTTVIGYGSLLASDNLAIRGFGTASLIGEITCVFTALVLVPAILAVSARPRRRTIGTG